jgi:thiamine kinase-like enzyme
MDPAQPHSVCRALMSALAPMGAPWAAAPLERLPDTGLAHDHVRLVGTGWLARIPKQSQMGLAAADNLAYQAACFERASITGHSPRLGAVLPPSASLPRGALLVEEIVGRPARLPDDLGAVVHALAALHRLPLPAPAQRPPLLDAFDPLRDLLAEIEAQVACADLAGLEEPVRDALDQGLQRLRAAVAAPQRPPRQLIAFDAHPGNFVVRPDGQAVLVDLEKCRYSYAGLDLAHATLYTSTTWDVATHAVLTHDQVAEAYRQWADAVGPELAQAARPWLGLLRQAMTLWSLSWCAKWKALSQRGASGSADGEDWSATHSADALVAHVRERVDHYLSAPVVVAMARELQDLQHRGSI